MGTQLSSIIKSEEIDIASLSGKKVVVDAYNMLYQFLTTIRQHDGTPLKDSKGDITSHLSGLFFRTTKLMKEGIKLAFVFDGLSPELKKEERERRAEIKRDARIKYEQAEAEGDIEMMRKYASRTAVLTKGMIEESKSLISALGLPLVQAPSEGEAQASYMVKRGDFFALVSQDTDGLLFGSPKIIRNLSITGKRKKAGSYSYDSIKPEIIDLGENLNLLGIDNEQLIAVAMLCGTDFNKGGIKGIGPKKALAYVKKHGKDFDSLFSELSWDTFFSHSWKEVFNLIKDMSVSDDYNLEWGRINEKEIFKLMIEKHDFSPERVNASLSELLNSQKQKGLGDYF